MYDWNEQLFEMIGRTRQHKSKAAAVIKAPCDMMVANNPNRSKAASVGQRTNKAKVIYEFLNSKQY